MNTTGFTIKNAIRTEVEKVLNCLSLDLSEVKSSVDVTQIDYPNMDMFLLAVSDDNARLVLDLIFDLADSKVNLPKYIYHKNYNYIEMNFKSEYHKYLSKKFIYIIICNNPLLLEEYMDPAEVSQMNLHLSVLCVISGFEYSIFQYLFQNNRTKDDKIKFLIKFPTGDEYEPIYKLSDTLDKKSISIITKYYLQNGSLCANLRHAYYIGLNWHGKL
jgi:hypothetical protein